MRRSVQVSVAIAAIAMTTLHAGGALAAIPAPPSSAGLADLATATTLQFSLERFAGVDRFATAVDISGQYEPAPAVVYVADGTNFADALSAAPAAAAAGGPLLLTQPTALPDTVRSEIVRLQPASIVVVGGIASVSDAVFAELATLVPRIVRLGGADRYETSRAIVTNAFGTTGAARVYLATGTSFPDALSASAAAGAQQSPVLLVPGSEPSLNAATIDLIAALRPVDARIAGGTGVVSTGIETSLAGLGLSGGYLRLGGEDRFATSRIINDDAFDTTDAVYLANGYTFPDALAGAALAGRDRVPLYITPGTCLNYPVVTDITTFAPSRIAILGGTGAMSTDTETLTPCPVAFTQPFSKFVPVSSPYGIRIHPITGVQTMHWGTDYARSGIAGTPIRAIAAGTVTSRVASSLTYGTGNMISVTHDNAIRSTAMHMASPTTFAVGDRVTAGQIIGYVGTTGGSTGPHLHLEIRVNGTPVDPFQFLIKAPFPL